MRDTKSKSINCLFLLFLRIFVVTATNVSYGQDTNASLSGTVLDPSNAAVPNARLTLTNSATGFASTFVSDAAGSSPFAISLQAITNWKRLPPDFSQRFKMASSFPLTRPLVWTFTSTLAVRRTP